MQSSEIGATTLQPRPRAPAVPAAASALATGEAAWLRVSKARAGVAALVLPLPDHLLATGTPAWHTNHHCPTGQTLADLLQHTLQALQADACAAPLAGLLQQAKPWRLAGVGMGLDLAAADCLLAPDPHDAYFRLARSAGPAPGTAVNTLLDGVLQALALFLDEAQVAGEFQDYAVIPRALLALGLRITRAGPVPLATPAAGQPQHSPKPLLMRAPDAVRRWVRGHQIFAVLSQGLVLVLQQLQVADARADNAAATNALQQMAQLYAASAAAFRFTAEFDPLVYSHTIRPSMCEPYTPKGFSGTLSCDHAVLVRQLVALRGPLANAALQCPSAYAGMRTAIEQVYADHKWVCARFDGAHQPSLRTSSHSGDSSAVDMLDRFRSRRLSLLP